MFFTSEKDIVYSLLCWGTIIFTSLAIFLNFSLSVLSIFSALIGLLAIGFLIWVWFGTNYKVEDKSIQIKYGPFKEKVLIQDINEIGKRKSKLITPALAIDRVLLRYGRYGEILITLKNESEFIDLLLTNNPRITLENHYL
ncbi:PH domain-containing protein [Amphibacillus jilinensis]|uniref:PH domain-containing protein n=1 Tax=Amphibacillus jilinensis TaxID=1216008 RepID=UPI00037902C5|nr:PH domain-containing protein [Amphibacillus jilinensis]